MIPEQSYAVRTWCVVGECRRCRKDECKLMDDRMLVWSLGDPIFQFSTSTTTQRVQGNKIIHTAQCLGVSGHYFVYCCSTWVLITGGKKGVLAKWRNMESHGISRIADAAGPYSTPPPACDTWMQGGGFLLCVMHTLMRMHMHMHQCVRHSHKYSPLHTPPWST
jgi:hypothetical protein